MTAGAGRGLRDRPVAESLGCAGSTALESTARVRCWSRRRKSRDFKDVWCAETFAVFRSRMGVRIW